MPAIGGAPGIRGPLSRGTFRSTALSTITVWTALEWDVFALVPGGSATPPTYLATLYEAREKSIRVELDGTGSGSFAVNRSSPECTEAILAQGNLVKVRIPEIHTGYIFAFFIETGDFTLISSDEAGGEMLHFGGRGNFSYLEYAEAWSESFIVGGQDPIAGVWRAYAAGTGSAPGQILRRMLEEMQDPDRPQQPLSLLTIDFDYATDSTLDPWEPSDATDEFSYQVGEDGLAIAERLIPTDLTVQMSPDFLLSAYNPTNFGRDLAGDAFGAGVVRFERGVNIAIELRREIQPAEARTHMLVGGEADKYGAATVTDAAARVTREAFMTAFGTGIATLNAIGAAELRNRLDKSDTIQFQIANRRTAVSLASPVTVGSVLATPGLATAGYYLPGPEGSNGDFWVGDTVRVHTGVGQFDYNETNWKVNAITITRDDDNHELIVIPELVSPSIPPLCPDYLPTASRYYPPIGGAAAADGSPSDIYGFCYYWRAGGSVPIVPTPGFTPSGSWHFPTFGYADAGAHNPAGVVDRNFAILGDAVRLIVVGAGTLTVYTRVTPLGPTATFNWQLQYWDDFLLDVVIDSDTGVAAGTTLTITVPDDGECVHYLDLGGTGSLETEGVAYDGADWMRA